MPGLEHLQMDAIRALYLAQSNGKLVPYIVRNLAYPSSATPNQQACAAALALGHFHDPVPAEALLDAMDEYGHQSVGPRGYQWEAACPDPHSLIWLGGMVCLLWQSKEQGLDKLHARIIKYFADHMAIAQSFWTNGGIRVPCTRARRSGKPLRPTWTVDSMAYCIIMGLGEEGLDKPSPEAKIIFQMLMMCNGDFQAIRSTVKPSQVKLHIAIRRWDAEVAYHGGYVAALVKDDTANYRLSWLDVDHNGEYIDVGADNVLDTLPEIASSGVNTKRQPDLIFGDPASYSTGTITPTSTSTPLTPAPIPTPAPTIDVSTFPGRLSALHLGHEDSRVRNRIFAQLPNATPAVYAQIANSVERFGIGEGQAQAMEWKRLITDLRVAGAK